MPTAATAPWFKIATAGPTIDGREIKPEWLNQAAATYDPKKYTARVWIEHMRGYSPSSEFNSVGKIEAVKVDTVDGRLSLYAQITASDSLKKLNQNGNKISPSIEINTNFCNTGLAYLDGVGVTDSPASLYTDILKFSAASNFTEPRGAGNSVFHQTADWSALNFSTAFEGQASAQPHQSPVDAAKNEEGFFNKLKQIVSDTFNASRENKTDKPATAHITEDGFAQFTKAFATTVVAEMSEMESRLSNSFNQQIDAQAQTIKGLSDELTAAKVDAQNNLDSYRQQRPAATGTAIEGKIAADC